jgi:hypothetical protein
MQQPPIRLSQLTTCFYWNEKCDYALMDILKNNWDSPLVYVVYCPTLLVIQILLKDKLEIVFSIYLFLKKPTQMIVLMRFCLILSLQFPLSKF